MTIPAPRGGGVLTISSAPSPACWILTPFMRFLPVRHGRRALIKRPFASPSPTACASACITAPDKSVSPGWSPITPPSAICATFTCWRRIKRRVGPVAGGMLPGPSADGDAAANHAGHQHRPWLYEKWGIAPSTAPILSGRSPDRTSTDGNFSARPPQFTHFPATLAIAAVRAHAGDKFYLLPLSRRIYARFSP